MAIWMHYSSAQIQLALQVTEISRRFCSYCNFGQAMEISRGSYSSFGFGCATKVSVYHAQIHPTVPVKEILWRFYSSLDVGHQVLASNDAALIAQIHLTAQAMRISMSVCSFPDPEHETMP